MERMKISTFQMKEDARRVRELNEAIPTLIKELESSMERLSGCWEGPAWGAYQETFAQSMETLTEIYKTMSNYTANVEQASQDYHRAEQDVCAKIDRVVVL